MWKTLVVSETSKRKGQGGHVLDRRRRETVHDQNLPSSDRLQRDPTGGRLHFLRLHEEEEKVVKEGAKILGDPGFEASVTCVRVPVYTAHTISVMAQFEKPITSSSALNVLEKASGIYVADDPRFSEYPTPANAAGKDYCLVGRIRDDCAFENALSFVVSGDQLLKGAALNAVQIAEYLAGERAVYHGPALKRRSISFMMVEVEVAVACSVGRRCRRVDDLYDFFGRFSVLILGIQNYAVVAGRSA